MVGAPAGHQPRRRTSLALIEAGSYAASLFFFTMAHDRAETIISYSGRDVSLMERSTS